MKKVFLAALLFLIGGLATDSVAQMNRRKIKHNNRRLSTYRGAKHVFSKEKRYNALGLSLNALNYYGDLAPLPQRVSTDISFTRPGVGVSFTHRFGPRYSFQGQFMFGTLKGSDAESANSGDNDNGFFRWQRNLSFRNRIKEISALAYFDLFENQGAYISRAKWTPYVFMGLAVFAHNPKAQVPDTDLNGNPFSNAGDWVSLRGLGTEGQYSQLDSGAVNTGVKPYSLTQLAIPFGVGVRFQINSLMDIWVDIGFRYTFTDYLDDVSRNYVNLDKLNSELARAMSYRTNELGPPTSPVTVGGYTVQNGYGHEGPQNMRGNSKERDIYMVTTVRLTYIIGKSFHKAKYR